MSNKNIIENKIFNGSSVLKKLNNMTDIVKINTIITDYLNRSILFDLSKLQHICNYFIIDMKQCSVEEFDLYSIKLFTALSNIYKELKSEKETNSEHFDLNLLSSNTQVNNIIIVFLSTLNRLHQSYNEKQKSITKQLPNFIKLIIKHEESTCLNKSLVNFELINSFILLNITCLSFFSSNMRSYESAIKNIIKNLTNHIITNTTLVEEDKNKTYKLLAINHSLLINLSNNETDKMNTLINEMFNNIDIVSNIAKPKEMSDNINYDTPTDVTPKILNNEKSSLLFKKYNTFYFNCLKSLFTTMKSKQKPFEFCFKSLLEKINLVTEVDLFIINKNNNEIVIKGLNYTEYRDYLIHSISLRLDFVQYLIAEFKDYLFLSCFSNLDSIFKKLITNKIHFYTCIYYNISVTELFISLIKISNAFFWNVQEDFFINFICSDIIDIIDSILNKQSTENEDYLLMKYFDYIYNLIDSKDFCFFKKVIIKNLVFLIDFLIPKDYFYSNEESSSSLSREAALFKNSFSSKIREKLKKIIKALIENNWKFKEIGFTEKILSCFGIKSEAFTYSFDNLDINWENEYKKRNNNILSIEEEQESIKIEDIKENYDTNKYNKKVFFTEVDLYNKQENNIITNYDLNLNLQNDNTEYDVANNIIVQVNDSKQLFKFKDESVSFTGKKRTLEKPNKNEFKSNIVFSSNSKEEVKHSNKDIKQEGNNSNMRMVNNINSFNLINKEQEAIENSINQFLLKLLQKHQETNLEISNNFDIIRAKLNKDDLSEANAQSKNEFDIPEIK